MVRCYSCGDETWVHIRPKRRKKYRQLGWSPAATRREYWVVRRRHDEYTGEWLVDVSEKMEGEDVFYTFLGDDIKEPWLDDIWD